MAKQDFYTSLVLILLGVIVVVESLRMPRFENLGVNPYTVPGIVPGFLGVIIGIFGFLMLIRSSRARAEQTAAEQLSLGERMRSESTRRLWLTLVLTLGYAAGLVGNLPFWMATFIFILIFIALFEWRSGMSSAQRIRSLSIALLQAVLVAAAVTLVFERVFLVRLP